MARRRKTNERCVGGKKEAVANQITEDTRYKGSGGMSVATTPTMMGVPKIVVLFTATRPRNSGGCTLSNDYGCHVSALVGFSCVYSPPIAPTGARDRLQERPASFQ